MNIFKRIAAAIHIITLRGYGEDEIELSDFIRECAHKRIVKIIDEKYSKIIEDKVGAVLADENYLATLVSRAVEGAVRERASYYENEKIAAIYERNFPEILSKLELEAVSKGLTLHMLKNISDTLLPKRGY